MRDSQRNYVSAAVVFPLYLMIKFILVGRAVKLLENVIQLHVMPFNTTKPLKTTQHSVPANLNGFRSTPQLCSCDSGLTMNMGGARQQTRIHPKATY